MHLLLPRPALRVSSEVVSPRAHNGFSTPPPFLSSPSFLPSFPLALYRPINIADNHRAANDDDDDEGGKNGPHVDVFALSTVIISLGRIVVAPDEWMVEVSHIIISWGAHSAHTCSWMGPGYGGKARRRRQVEAIRLTKNEPTPPPFTYKHRHCIKVVTLVFMGGNKVDTNSTKYS